ncbi:hypothetical protein H9Q70_008070 [Fusarium xylarioides]|nr:hypothetical protein H9Q70_008070 [Fusarium xylarioides]KAG5816962.1 hypothetical protein H9Q71_002141 [Fusarium xylarioides]KAG5828093.1 hypothetical protein H9Q74_001810 [Fusarium xylarioides]
MYTCTSRPITRAARGPQPTFPKVEVNNWGGGSSWCFLALLLVRYLDLVFSASASASALHLHLHQRPPSHFSPVSSSFPRSSSRSNPLYSRFCLASNHTK